MSTGKLACSSQSPMKTGVKKMANTMMNARSWGLKSTEYSSTASASHRMVGHDEY